jgi:hypothetical protein
MKGLITKKPGPGRPAAGREHIQVIKIWNKYRELCLCMPGWTGAIKGKKMVVQ